MKVVIQRVTRASVTIEQQLFSSISKGMLVLVGIQADDTDEDINWLASKIVNLRIFDDENGVMNKSILESGGEILAVSQFTLMARTKKRATVPHILMPPLPPSLSRYMKKFVATLSQELHKEVQTGTIRGQICKWSC